MARHTTKPESILMNEIHHLKELKQHLHNAELGHLVVKGQEGVTRERIEQQRNRITKLIEEFSDIGN